MTVRDYKPETDRERVEQIYRDMGMDYRLPDLENPLFIVRKVYEQDGQLLAAEFLKVQAEAYMLLSCDLDTVGKTRAIAHLSKETENEAYNRGLDTIAAYIPDDISNKFSKRLKLLGWDTARKGWVTWFRELI